MPESANEKSSGAIDGSMDPAAVLLSCFAKIMTVSRLPQPKSGLSDLLHTRVNTFQPANSHILTSLPLHKSYLTSLTRLDRVVSKLPVGFYFTRPNQQSFHSTSTPRRPSRLHSYHCRSFVHISAMSCLTTYSVFSTKRCHELPNSNQLPLSSHA
jgi:hypothetical protein